MIQERDKLMQQRETYKASEAGEWDDCVLHSATHAPQARARNRGKGLGGTVTVGGRAEEEIAETVVSGLTGAHVQPMVSFAVSGWGAATSMTDFRLIHSILQPYVLTSR